MIIPISIEVEMNREWIFDEDTLYVIGETNYVVPLDFVSKNYKLCPTNGNASTLNMFLDVYAPETDGQFLYNLAIEQGCLIEDKGVCMDKESEAM